MSIPHTDSLYTLLKDDVPRAEGVNATQKSVTLMSQLSNFQKERKAASLTKPYDKVSISSSELVDRIFIDACAEKRRRILGNVSREQFDEQFGKGRERFKKKMSNTTQRLMSIFMMKSFPETYFFPEIASELCRTGLLTNQATLKNRLMGTAAVIMAAMNEESSLGMMLGIAESHLRKRQKEHYTAKAVEFTLLTFSYYGVKESSRDLGEWFFFWKVFGSMLGLSQKHLHDSFGEAKERMGILQARCPWPPGADSAKLLNAFIEVFLKNESAVEDAIADGQISPLMEKYLRMVGRWTSV